MLPRECKYMQGACYSHVQVTVGLSPTGNNNSRRELEILSLSYLSILPQQHFQPLYKWALKLPEINLRFPGYQCKGMGEICEPLTALISFMNAPVHCESESHRQTGHVQIIIVQKLGFTLASPGEQEMLGCERTPVWHHCWWNDAASFGVD